jgi:hypothetical protein
MCGGGGGGDAGQPGEVVREANKANTKESLKAESQATRNAQRSLTPKVQEAAQAYRSTPQYIKGGLNPQFKVAKENYEKLRDQSIALTNKLVDLGKRINRS